MKQILAVVALLLAAGCNKMDDALPSAPKATTFRGVIAEEESRTYLDENIRLRWTAGDLITLFEGITRNKKYMFMGETGDNAGDFEYVSQGFGTGNEVDRYYAIYPYASTNKLHEDGYLTYTFPTTQHYVEGSVGLGANPMVAITADLDDFDLIFRNVAAFLRVCLYGTDQTVGSITLTTNSGEAIAGKSTITPTYGGNPTCVMTEKTATVTLDCGDGGIALGKTQEEATVFWIVVPPVTMSTGFTVTVNGYYGGSQSFAVESALTFSRNKYKSMTRELTIASSDTNMGVDGWGDGSTNEGTAE